MLKSYTYHWLHIPTGRRGLRVVQYFSRAEFLSMLDTYNRLGRDTSTLEEGFMGLDMYLQARQFLSGYHCHCVECHASE